MSLYADYKLEREGKHTIEGIHGFVTYQIENEVIYIENIFVVKDFRGEGVAIKLADQAVEEGKKLGCKKALGSVVPNTAGATESMRVMIAYGFKLQSSQNNFIWLEKEI